MESLPVDCHGFNKICAVLSSGCVMWCPCRNLFDPVFLCPLIQGLQWGFGEYEGDYWKKTSNALEGNHCLRSLHIHCSRPWDAPHEWYEMTESLCRNERLTDLSIEGSYYNLRGMYRVPDGCVQSL